MVSSTGEKCYSIRHTFFFFFGWAWLSTCIWGPSRQDTDFIIWHNSICMPLKLKSVHPSILELLVLVPGAAQFSSVHLGPRDCFFYYLQFHHATHNDPKPRPNWIWVKVITSLCRVDHIHVSLATSYRSFLMISRQTSVFWVWSGTPSHPTMYSSTAQRPAERCLICSGYSPWSPTSIT